MHINEFGVTQKSCVMSQTRLHKIAPGAETRQKRFFPRVPVHDIPSFLVSI